MDDRFSIAYLPCPCCSHQVEIEFVELSGTALLSCDVCGRAIDRALMGRLRLALRAQQARRARLDLQPLKAAV